MSLLTQLMDAFRMRANPDQAQKLRAMYDKAKNEEVTQYWYEFYCNGHCTLCGNYGYIDTRHARTPAGVKCGRLNWCICPNGQTLRDQIGGHPSLSIDGRLGKAI